MLLGPGRAMVVFATADLEEDVDATILGFEAAAKVVADFAVDPLVGICNGLATFVEETLDDVVPVTARVVTADGATRDVVVAAAPEARVVYDG